MIFVDTNIVIDLIEQPDTDEASWTRDAFRRGSADRMVSNLIVLAELAGQIAAPEEVAATLGTFDIELMDMTIDAAYRSGQAFRDYRRRGGQRTTILADFLIGGHAAALGARLMTRDRRLAGYFPDLTLITPET